MQTTATKYDPYLRCRTAYFDDAAEAERFKTYQLGFRVVETTPGMLWRVDLAGDRPEPELFEPVQHTLNF